MKNKKIVLLIGTIILIGIIIATALFLLGGHEPVGNTFVQSVSQMPLPSGVGGGG